MTLGWVAAARRFRRPETRFQGIAMQAEIPMRRVTAIRCYPSGERDDPDQRVLNVLECGHVVSFEGANAVAALLAKRQLCLKCAEEAKAEASSSEARPPLPDSAA